MPKRSVARLACASAAFAAAIALSGCGSDSPACVFGPDGCQGGGGPGALGQPAVLPGDDQVILAAAPTARAFPSGSGFSGETPIVVVFSESMAASTLQGTIGVFPDVPGFPGLGASPQALLANDRVLIIFPPAELDDGDYVIRVADGETVTDITGQELVGGGELGTFSVGGGGTEPQLVASFPDVSDGVVTVPPATPVIVAFDRDMDALSVNPTTFGLEVDGFPFADHDPMPLPQEPPGIERVFISPGTGDPSPFGTGVSVDMILSTGIQAEDQTSFGGQTLTFTTQALGSPVGAAILSEPADGIGIDNLTAMHPQELTVQIDLVDASDGDVLVLNLFGTAEDPEDPTVQQLVARRRTKVLNGTDPITSALYLRTEVDIENAFILDGDVAFSFHVERAIGGETQATPVRVLDVDPDTSGIQDPRLDRVRPTVSELLYPGEMTDVFHSDLRDLVLVGQADEMISAAEVLPVGSGVSGSKPAVVGSDSSGLFIAKPVPLDVIPVGTTVDYEYTVFDEVGNASDPVAGPVPFTFRQLGVVGPDEFLPMETIDVEVFDANTLAPIMDAVVYTHEDLGDGTFPFQEKQLTTADGLATVFSAQTMNAGTILTVEAEGYDLFTFHGICADRISVPLRRSDLGVATSVGVLTTTSALASVVLADPDQTLKYDDTRLFQVAEPTFTGDDCVTPPFGGSITCDFGPVFIRPERIGALSFFAGELNQTVFDPDDLLRAFELQLPQAPTPGGGADATSIVVSFLLEETDPVDMEEPVELMGLPTLSASPFIGLTDLVGDPDTTGDPFVTVEALIPGIPGAVTVGQGLAFQLTSTTWTLRAAIPGAVDSLGFFPQMGIIDPDLFLRVELRDTDENDPIPGNRVGRRPRMSGLGSLIPPSFLVAPDVPTVTEPMPAAVVGPSFDVTFEDAIPDLSLQGGLYVVTVADSTGRRWDVVLEDPDDTGPGAPPSVHLPDILAEGGVPLADGSLTCTVAAYGWPTFDATNFLFSDIEREHDIFGESAPVVFMQQTSP